MRAISASAAVTRSAIGSRCWARLARRPWTSIARLKIVSVNSTFRLANARRARTRVCSCRFRVENRTSNSTIEQVVASPDSICYRTTALNASLPLELEQPGEPADLAEPGPPLGKPVRATVRRHRSGNLPPTPVADHELGKSGKRGVGQSLELRGRLPRCTRDESPSGPGDPT